MAGLEPAYVRALAGSGPDVVGRSCLLSYIDRCRDFTLPAGAAFALGSTPRRGPSLASTVASLDSAGFPNTTFRRWALSSLHGGEIPLTSGRRLSLRCVISGG